MFRWVAESPTFSLSQSRDFRSSQSSNHSLRIRLYGRLVKMGAGCFQGTGLQCWGEAEQPTYCRPPSTSHLYYDASFSGNPLSQWVVIPSRWARCQSEDTPMRRDECSFQNERKSRKSTGLRRHLAGGFQWHRVYLLCWLWMANIKTSDQTWLLNVFWRGFRSFLRDRAIPVGFSAS